MHTRSRESQNETEVEDGVARRLRAIEVTAGCLERGPHPSNIPIWKGSIETRWSDQAPWWCDLSTLKLPEIPR